MQAASGPLAGMGTVLLTPLDQPEVGIGANASQSGSGARSIASWPTSVITLPVKVTITVSPDGRARRGGQALALQVPGDDGGPCVEAAGGELPAQGGDPVADAAGRPLRAPVRPPGPRLEVVGRLPDTVLPGGADAHG
jgi:hypothetical protein